MNNIRVLPPWTEPRDLSGAKQAILSLGRSMHEHAYILGKTLAWVKAQVGHGGFAGWVKSNVWFSERTAQRALAFAAACDRAQTLLEYHPRKIDTVSDLGALPEPIDFAKLAKLNCAYELLDESDRGIAEQCAADNQEAAEIALEMSELRAINLDGIRDPTELKDMIDRATSLMNRAHVLKIKSLRELGKILNSLPKHDHDGLFALANLPAAVRRDLCAERLAELI